MSPDLAVIIPSFGRPGSVERTALAFAETGADELPVIYALRADDPGLDEYRANVAEWFAFGEVFVAGAEPMAPAINAASRHVVDDLDPYAIAVLNDDHLPRTPGWHGRYLDELTALDPIGLVYPDDGLRGEKLATTWAVHGAWIKVLNRMVPARVDHQYADNAVQDLASAVGRLRYLGDLLVEHMHPLAKDADGKPKAATDPGYQRVNSAAQASQDRMNYRVWQGSQKRQRQIAALRACIAAGGVAE
jgi:hypothetical protein